MRYRSRCLRSTCAVLFVASLVLCAGILSVVPVDDRPLSTIASFELEEDEVEEHGDCNAMAVCVVAHFKPTVSRDTCQDPMLGPARIGHSGHTDSRGPPQG